METMIDKAEQEEQTLAPVNVERAELDPMIERMAANPAVDVDKFERLIAMRERILAHQAKAEFDAAYATMAPQIPAISEKGEIVVKGTLRSKYARLEDIQAAVKPILAEHGFALRYRTEWPDDRQGVIRVVGILTHRNGHSEESVFEAPMDRSEFRTDVQSQGSTISYGRRYTTIDLLNIETRGADDDGKKSGRPTPPDGYDDAKLALSHEADKGLAALEKAFQALDKGHRQYLTQSDPEDYRKMRQRAQSVKGGRA